ncbi:MAG: hypothetical protein M3Q07_10715 [Pseudobdellovibrionaceae bacterium]|nr:hypothetical protein [Pseudobdellovibrionaceae bacterium]
MLDPLESWVPVHSNSFEVYLPGMPSVMEYAGADKETMESMKVRTFTVQQGSGAFMIAEVDLSASMLQSAQDMDILKKMEFFESSLQHNVKRMAGTIKQTRLITFRGFDAQLATIEVQDHRFESIMFIGNNHHYQLQFLAKVVDWDSKDVAESRKQFFDTFKLLKRKEPS